MTKQRALPQTLEMPCRLRTEGRTGTMRLSSLSQVINSKVRRTDQKVLASHEGQLEVAQKKGLEKQRNSVQIIMTAAFLPSTDANPRSVPSVCPAADGDWQFLSWILAFSVTKWGDCPLSVRLVCQSHILMEERFTVNVQLQNTGRKSVSQAATRLS